MQEWPIVRKRLSELVPAVYNPREISDESLKGLTISMEKFGIVQSIVYNKRTGNIVGGHQRYKVLVASGVTEVDVTEVDLSEMDEKALNVALNNPTIQGDFDVKTKDLLKMIQDGSEATFKDLRCDALAELLDISLKEPKPKEDAEPRTDIAEELAREWDVRPGDLWALGDHLLFCGDSVLPESFIKILGEDKAAMAITSPPSISTAEYEDKGISEWLCVVKPVISNLSRACGIVVWQSGDLYGTSNQFIEPLHHHATTCFMDSSSKLLWTRIWEKIPARPTSVRQLNSDKPKPQPEFVTAFAGDIDEINEADMKSYEWITAYAGHMHKFVKRLSKKEHREWGYSGIWLLEEVPGKKGQPIMFPIDLPIRCIKMHSDEGNIVVDPFCGTGTTIMACENTGRHARCIEKSPLMVAISIQRFFDATKKKPRKL